MARIRTIKPEHWGDQTTGSLSFAARLLELGARNFADDEGLVTWSPEFLRAELFRYAADASADRVAAWMREVEEAGIVYVYSSTRVRHKIAFIVGFRVGPLSQRIEKPGPAVLPVPNWRDPAVVLTYARRDNWVCRTCQAPVNERFEQDPALARFNPVCERIRELSPRFHAIDDPSNIALVHVACAKGPETDGDGFPVSPIPGTFREPSGNVPGTVRDRSGAPSRPDTPVAQLQRRNTPESAPAAPVTAAQPIPGTFQERSGNTPALPAPAEQARHDEPEGLFPAAEPAAPAKRARKKAAPKPVDPVLAERAATAQKLTATWWDELGTKPSGKNAFIGTKKIVESLLAVGHAPEKIAAALQVCGYSVTVPALEFRLRQLDERATGATVMPFGPRPNATDARRASVHAATEAAKRTAAEAVRRRSGSTG